MPEGKKSASRSVLEALSSDKMKAALRAVLPKFMTYDRFFQMAVAAAKVQANSKYVVDKGSILVCVYNAAKYGLELNDSLGHCYLVPFRKVCTLIVGYKGLLELVRRSGKVADIHAFIRYEKDEFDYYVDEHGPHIRYKPYLDGDPGKPICGVSIAQFTDPNMKPSIDVMPYARIEAIKKAALARTPKSPWGVKLYEPEMAKKTVLRHHCKTLPMSTEVAEVIDLDEKVERDEMPLLDMPDELKGDTGNVVDGEFTEAVEDTQTEEQPERSKKQVYNLTLAKVVKNLGSEAAKEAIDEIVGKTLGDRAPADVDVNDEVWDTIISNLEGLMK